MKPDAIPQDLRPERGSVCVRVCKPFYQADICSFNRKPFIPGRVSLSMADCIGSGAGDLEPALEASPQGECVGEEKHMGKKPGSKLTGTREAAGKTGLKPGRILDGIGRRGFLLFALN
ncbi:hypothetical protein ZHAS_00020670 [Anopheles sinensis]|uniref:Uncharacterized protein n=1 Tax=Anopheles sinensis TaxID=74873 RepID=A0A084WQD1_ANOSI|nr:hypothetical protein ZHAS_00020670 [Anopheles sinensis]